MSKRIKIRYEKCGKKSPVFDTGDWICFKCDDGGKPEVDLSVTGDFWMGLFSGLSIIIVFVIIIGGIIVLFL